MSSRKRRGRPTQPHTSGGHASQAQNSDRMPLLSFGDGHVKAVKSQGKQVTGKKKTGKGSKFNEIFGFSFEDVKSFDSVVSLLYRPCDPSCLGVVRILFGLLMLLDIPQERGLGHADLKWGDPFQCHFPLFDFLQPLRLEWMCILYLFMWIGAAGIMLGLLFRLSCLMFLVPYWYMFLLDKSSWNNHSYLYGLLTLLLFVSQAHRYWSIDGLLSSSVSNSHVPLWNYGLLRVQIFIMYFVAGLKKFDADWIHGYSMTDLSYHWIFDPFKVLLTQEQIEYWIIHFGGFFLDLTIGFWLFMDCTRPYALLFCGAFHIMNSQLFHIGMFPFVCLATMPLFCSTDWPRKIARKFPTWMRKVLPHCQDPQSSSCCLYKSKGKSGKTNGSTKKLTSETRKCSVSWSHRFTTLFVALYVGLQCFLPYSHFITKGYNNWTNGLYGYSWDMMVHSWLTLHVEVTVKDKLTGELHFLDPDVWVNSERWNSHADMTKQYAKCLEQNLQHFNLTSVEIYIDVWKSLNGRFQQRVFDPNRDILSADWSPLTEVDWVMPLLTDLSSWRDRLTEVENRVQQWSEHADVIFVADFPGLTLENFISKDLSNVTVEVLEGKVTIQFTNNTNVTLDAGQRTEIIPGEFHHIHTISAKPSCYMYVYYNTTAETGPNMDEDETTNIQDTPAKVLLNFLSEKVRLFERSMWIVVNSILNLTLSVPMVRRVPLREEAGLKLSPN